MSKHQPEEFRIQPEETKGESMEVIIGEIRSVTKKIEDMVGNTDIVPEHLDKALEEARAIAGKYEFTEGDEDFDVALDILVDTIKNTELLEEDVARRFSDKAGAVE